VRGQREREIETDDGTGGESRPSKQKIRLKSRFFPRHRRGTSIRSDRRTDLLRSGSRADAQRRKGRRAIRVFQPWTPQARTFETRSEHRSLAIQRGSLDRAESSSDLRLVRTIDNLQKRFETHNIPPAFRSSDRNSERTTFVIDDVALLSKQRHHHPDKHTIPYDKTRQGRELTLSRPVCGNFSCYASSVPQPFVAISPCLSGLSSRRSSGIAKENSRRRAFLACFLSLPRTLVCSSPSLSSSVSRGRDRRSLRRGETASAAYVRDLGVPFSLGVLGPAMLPLFRSLLIVRQKLSFTAVIERN